MPEPLSFSPDRGPVLVESQVSPASAAPKILDLRETPLNRAHRQWERGLSATDHTEAIEAFEKAIEIYRSLPDRKSAMAQSQVALAERLADRDQEGDREYALELLEEALPVLRGPAMHSPRKRALALEERLAS